MLLIFVRLSNGSVQLSYHLHLDLLSTLFLKTKVLTKALLLGNCPTWRTNSFQYIYL